MKDFFDTGRADAGEAREDLIRPHQPRVDPSMQEVYNRWQDTISVCTPGALVNTVFKRVPFLGLFGFSLLVNACLTCLVVCPGLGDFSTSISVVLL